MTPVSLFDITQHLCYFRHFYAASSSYGLLQILRDRDCSLLARAHRADDCLGSGNRVSAGVHALPRRCKGIVVYRDITLARLFDSLTSSNFLPSLYRLNFFVNF